VRVGEDAFAPRPGGYVAVMTDPTDEPDQDAEPTMTAPPELRPDAGASELNPEGRADSPDAADADGEA
jgi:hypothetical protein